MAAFDGSFVSLIVFIILSVATQLVSREASQYDQDEFVIEQPLIVPRW